MNNFRMIKDKYPGADINGLLRYIAVDPRQYSAAEMLLLFEHYQKECVYE